MTTKIILKNVRLSYANLFEPRENMSGELRYGTALIIPKGHPQVKALQAAIQEEGKEKFGKKWEAIFKKKGPFLKDADEDGTGEEKPEYENSFYLNSSSKRKPQVVDRQLQPIMSDEDIFSGCWGNVSIAVYGFEATQDGKVVNAGVTFGLNNVQKVKEDERLGGAANADEEFEAMDDDEEEGFEIS